MITNTVFVPRGYALSITSDAYSSGTYVRLGNPGNSKSTPVAITASSTATVGPFNESYTYELESTNNSFSTSLSHSGVFDSTDSSGYATNIVTSNVGTAETGTTAVEYGDAYQHTTVLTVDTTLPAIAGGADLAVGKLLYTFPEGAIVVKQAHINLAITQSEDNITADTPDGGLGTTIASGEVSVLGGTAAFENILTGQTFGDCDGTAEVKTVAGQVLVIESGDDHTVYFNVADGWAADGDVAAGLSGTVVLHWQFMA